MVLGIDIFVRQIRRICSCHLEADSLTIGGSRVIRRHRTIHGNCLLERFSANNQISSISKTTNRSILSFCKLPNKAAENNLGLSLVDIRVFPEDPFSPRANPIPGLITIWATE
jgi:hypothetical protein